MIRPSRFIKQISRHIRREKRLSVGSFLVLAIVLILIDLFWIASINLNEQYRQVLQTVRMELFLSDRVPDSALAIIEQTLLSLEDASSVSFISKDEAARILESDLGSNILEGLDSNPLPRSFILFFGETKNLKALDAMEKQLLRMEGVEAVEFGRPWIQKVENVGRNLRRVGYAVGGLILFVVLLTMANTNRLTARSKSKDFYQLRLLGAGPSYLIYPFLAEGFLSAFIAAALGWALLLNIAGQISFETFTVIMPGIRDVLVYSLLAGFTGLVGAYLGIRRLLIS
jgi:cell division transport system permease protein